MRLISVIVSLAVLLGAACAASFPNLVDDTFSAVKNAPREQFVVFYHSSNPDHLRNLEVRFSY
jgi:hypothetical protein